MLVICSIIWISTLILGLDAIACDDENALATQPCDYTSTEALASKRLFKNRPIQPPKQPDNDKMKAYCAGFDRRYVSNSWDEDGDNYRVTCSRESQTRTRKSWWELDDAGKKKYVLAFQQMAEAGETAAFAQSHGAGKGQNGFRDYHGNSEFLPYHRGLLYRFESKVRELTPAAHISNDLNYFKDFAIPYLDMTVNNKWGADFRQNWKDIINNNKNQGLGESHRHNSNPCPCLKSGRFGSNAQNQNGWKYQPSCMNRADGKNCLRRCTHKDQKFPGPAELLSPRNLNIANNQYVNMGCHNGDCPVHGWPHNEIGGLGKNPTQAGEKQGTLANGEYSPEDPIFYLHHAWVDYTWALWQMCHGYQNYQTVPGNWYQNWGAISAMNDEIKYGGARNWNHPNAGGPQRSPVITSPVYDDNKMVKDLLLLHGGDISQDDTDKRGNGFWDSVRYQKGNFWTRAGIQARITATNCNADARGWFVDNRRRLNEEGGDNSNATMMELIGNDERRLLSNNNGGVVVSHGHETHQTHHDQISVSTIMQTKGIHKGITDTIQEVSTGTKEEEPKDKTIFPHCMPEAEKLLKKGGTKYETKEGMEQFQKDMADKECNCRLGKDKCEELQDAAKCDEFKWDEKMKDIIIPKWEQLKAITPKCHQENREHLFWWATQWGVLRALCLGCYDNRCASYDKIAEQCQAAELRKPPPNTQSIAHVSFENREESNNYDTDEDGDDFDKQYINYHDYHDRIIDDRYYPDQHYPNNNNSKLIVTLMVIISICCICGVILFCIGGIGGIAGAIIGAEAYSYFDRNKQLHSDYKKVNLYEDDEDDRDDENGKNDEIDQDV